MARSECTHVGRPRGFDKDIALEKALEVFWQKGYDGASLADLTEAMGINKPSMYSAFGNKDQLFLQAIEAYENRPCAFFDPALELPTAYQAVESMLRGAAINFTEQDHPQGCLIVQGALSCSETAQHVKEALIEKRQNGEKRLRDRFERAQKEGEIPDTTDITTLARYIGTVLQGMAIQANNGASTDELMDVVELTFSVLPGLSKPEGAE